MHGDVWLPAELALNVRTPRHARLPLPVPEQVRGGGARGGARAAPSKHNMRQPKRVETSRTLSTTLRNIGHPAPPKQGTQNCLR